MPWPDGLEYAATAVNLDHGLGPVLHFGGYSYPSRYTEGYPLILAVAYPILGGHVERLCLVTMVMGLVAISSLYLLSFMMFGRLSAFLSGALLALSPLFITYSTLVLSDVPTFAMTILTAIAFYHASDAADSPSSGIIAAALCGLLAGFTIIIRPTNAVILIAMLVATMAISFRPRLTQLFPALIAFAIGLVVLPAWQTWTNIRYLGGPMRSGYTFWVPEVYGSLGKTFGVRFLLGPTMPGNPHGNLITYLLAVSGLDGMLGDPGDPRYTLYPFAAAVFAAVGIAVTLKSQTGSVLRLTWLGLAFLIALATLYLFYFFTEIAFILPAAFIVFAAAGFGLVTANRALREARVRKRKSARDLAVIGLVIALDLILALSVATETAGRVSSKPSRSRMVPALLGVRAQLPSDAIVVSNISLQFLELYLATAKTQLIGLNAFDPGGQFTDYHLSRLYTKRSEGWNGLPPPVLFAGQQIDNAEVKKLDEAARTGKSIYLLLNAPERQDYADLLKDELAQIEASFAINPIARSDLVELDRLSPR